MGKNKKKRRTIHSHQNSNTPSSQQLGKEIKARQFFSLAFGCAIGVGWIIVLGEWLEIAGPLGALLAFVAGAFVMIIVGLCYAELASMFPVSGGEVAYAYEIFGVKASFAMGWFLAFAYIIVTSFEAISVGWIVGTIFPAFKGITLYTSGGDPIQLGSLLLGLGGMIVLTYINCRGVRSAAIFQEVFTYGLLILSIVFISAGLIYGKMSNLLPLFSKTGTAPVLGGILAIFMTVPFWLAGFNVIPQTIEEKAPGTSLGLVVRMILFSIGSAGCFYLLVILSASMTMPWKELLPLELPAAGAFEAAFRSSLMAKVVLFAGLCGIVTTWNSVFVSASRIIFALGRARIIPPIFGKIHFYFKSPFISVIFVGIIGSLGAFLGRRAILPIINVGGCCFGFAFLFSCIGVIRLRYVRPDQHRPYRIPGGNVTAAIGVLCSLSMVILSLYQPYVNSKGKLPIEWIFILFWTLLGVLFWIGARKIRAQVSEPERRKLILSSYAISENGMGGDKEK